MSAKRCACPRFVTANECIDARYGKNDYDERCECSCHDEDDDETRDWYADQRRGRSQDHQLSRIKDNQ